MQKMYIAVIAVTLFLTTLFILDTIHAYDRQLNAKGLLQTKESRNVYDLLATELPQDWKKPTVDQERLKILDPNEREIKEEKKFEGSGMTREELGRHGWTILHMISATLPEEFDEPFVFKINVFLNLFAQFYPCKICAEHFIKLVNQHPYSGKTREDFMQYMCQLHNMVNRKIGHALYDCAKVHDQWGGYCGCEEELKNSIAKYAELPAE